MWRRAYLLLILVRLYFAFSPSYIHPDENFQGPEVIAGKIFGFAHHLTWEFDPSQPVRSVFPLWPVYGLPMVVLRWLWTETGKEEVAPKIIYYTLRGVMFILSFVLEDWAIHELVHSPRQRRVVMVLVASSYVTWTYQTHTFSNSIETLVVLWSVVLIQRLMENQHSSTHTSAILGALVIFGIFNRITFPAFILLPGLYLLPHFISKPLTLLTTALSGLLTLLLAIVLDSTFYNHSFSLTKPLLTPFSLLTYNLSSTNLATHGTHPLYTHTLINLPLLLLPALPFLRPTTSSLAALLGVLLLSFFPHQEPRFLLPAVPLLLSSIRLPVTSRGKKWFFAAWIAFNLPLGMLMGIYHQGGVVPMQIRLGEMAKEGVFSQERMEVLWWKTYSPPVWLLDGVAGEEKLVTIDLMGSPLEELVGEVSKRVGICGRRDQGKDVLVVAPRGRWDFRDWREEGTEWKWDEVATVWRHIGLDDLDFGEEGVVGTWRRVWGDRGLSAWRVSRRCG